jgi:hypothetical protein
MARNTKVGLTKSLETIYGLATKKQWHLQGKGMVQQR